MEENTNLPSQPAETLEPKWATAKLVLGILSMVLFIVITFQSCIVGLGNTLTDNGEVGGSFGFLIALNLLASGIIAVAARKATGKTAMIIAAVLLWLSFFLAKVFAGSYTDLTVWGFIAFAFGVVYLLSAARTKKQTIITAVAAAVFLALMLIL